MCSIIGSFDKNEIRQLAELNRYRGEHSHSVAVFNDRFKNVYLSQEFGPLNIDNHDLPTGYIICHQQAPTTGVRDRKSIHPAKNHQLMLWHNGIIKESTLKKWIYDEDVYDEWDTKWMLNMIYEKGQHAYTYFDGSFACVLYTGASTVQNTLSVFRNANSPMFMHENTISSTKFEGSKPIEPGIVYKMFNGSAGWEKTDITFKTVDQFYWSPE